MATATKLELNTIEKSLDITSYRGMVESLQYLTTSRPDIIFATCLCARFQTDLGKSHLVAIERNFIYLKGTPNLGIWYHRESSFDLIGYSDTFYAGCKIDRKSTTGQFLGNKLESWFSKKQNSVFTSTAEAEYIAGGSCCAQILWMRNQLFDYGLHMDKISIFFNHTSVIAITENPVQHSRTKPIDIKYHFIREHVMNDIVELHFVPSEHQIADIFTKPLDKSTSSRLVSELGIYFFKIHAICNEARNKVGFLESVMRKYNFGQVKVTLSMDISYQLTIKLISYHCLGITTLNILGGIVQFDITSLVLLIEL